MRDEFEFEDIVVTVTIAKSFSGENGKDYQFSSVGKTLECLKKEIKKMFQGEDIFISIFSSGDAKRAAERKVFLEQERQIEEFRWVEIEEARDTEVPAQMYDQQLLREQLLLFDKDIDIIDYIETEKVLAVDELRQLTGLSFSLIKICKELTFKKRPEIDVSFKDVKLSKEKLEQIEAQCMATLLRVKEERKRTEACCICLSKKSKVVVFPCMHMVLCADCTDQVKRCPICMQPIIEFHEVFQ